MIPPEPPRFRRQAAPADGTKVFRKNHAHPSGSAWFSVFCGWGTPFAVKKSPTLLHNNQTAPPLFSPLASFLPSLKTSGNPFLIHLGSGAGRNRGRPPQAGAAAHVCTESADRKAAALPKQRKSPKDNSSPGVPRMLRSAKRPSALPRRPAPSNILPFTLSC